MTSYNRRILLVEELSTKVGFYNRAFTQRNAARVNSEYFPQWLAKGVEFFWIVWGGYQVTESARAHSYYSS